MVETLKIHGKTFRVEYNENALHTILDGLDIVKSTSRAIVERSIVYFACYPKKLGFIYDAIALERTLSPNTVAVHLRNAIITAEYNGGLKNIDDLIGAEIYDYDYGLSSKSFVAILSSYLKSCGLLNVKTVDNSIL